jgi:hypothetical protein
MVVFMMCSFEVFKCAGPTALVAGAFVFGRKIEMDCQPKEVLDLRADFDAAAERYAIPS